MRVISVITVKDGTVNDMESFGIFEEQLSGDVVKLAEKLFSEKCIEYGADENDLDDLIEEGYYAGSNYYAGGSFSINLVWSNIKPCNLYRVFFLYNKYNQNAMETVHFTLGADFSKMNRERMYKEYKEYFEF